MIEEDWAGLSGRREEKSRSLAPLGMTARPQKSEGAALGDISALAC